MKINKAFTPLERISLTGFTLIEMLIVTAMLAVVSLALYATFTSGINIWQRVNQEMPAQEVGIFFEKFTSDIKNSVKVTNITFLGNEDGFELPALVNSRRLGRTVGKVQYKFSYSNGGATRRQMDYSDIYDGENGTEEVLLRNVKALKFQYYVYYSERQEYLWQDEQAGQALPLAIRIELELKNNDQTNKFTKTVSIPIS